MFYNWDFHDRELLTKGPRNTLPKFIQVTFLGPKAESCDQNLDKLFFNIFCVPMSVMRVHVKRSN